YDANFGIEPLVINTKFTQAFLDDRPAWLACGAPCCPTLLAAHTADVAVGDRLAILPDRSRKPTVVPLWKVMVGPRADELNRTRKGPVILWSPFFGQDFLPLRIQLRAC